MACPCDLIESIRDRWLRDEQLRELVPVSSGPENRVFGQGEAVEPTRPYVVLGDLPELDRSTTADGVEVRRPVRVRMYTNTKQEAASIVARMREVFTGCLDGMCVEDGTVLRGRLLHQGGEYVSKGVYFRQLLLSLAIAQEWS